MYGIPTINFYNGTGLCQGWRRRAGKSALRTTPAEQSLGDLSMRFNRERRRFSAPARDGAHA